MEYKKALLLLEQFCVRQERCLLHVEKKLSELEINNLSKEKIIIHLLENNYINEERFAKAFCNDKFKFNKWGKQKLSYLLKQLNIPENKIQKGLDSINNNDYYVLLLTILEKKLNQDFSMESKNKALKHAFQKGFEYNLSLKAISEIVS